MAIYSLKSLSSSQDFITIIKETEEGYVVRIIRDQDGYEDITTDFISHSLFDACLRTGYLTKIETAEDRMAANA